MWSGSRWQKVQNCGSDLFVFVVCLFCLFAVLVLCVGFFNSVVAGTMYSGRVQVGDHLSLGPDFHGKWTTCMVKSIHCKGLPVNNVGSGQSASFGLRKIGGDKTKLERKGIRKGMVMVDPALEGSTREFEGTSLFCFYEISFYCFVYNWVLSIVFVCLNCFVFFSRRVYSLFVILVALRVHAQHFHNTQRKS